MSPSPPPKPEPVQAVVPGGTGGCCRGGASAGTGTAAARPASTPAQEFGRVVQAQTAGFDVRVQTNKQSYRIGQDKLSFTVQAEREGYVYVFVYGADKALVRLYPSVSAGALRVRKGQMLKLPPPPDSFDTTGPAGTTDMLVMVSARQRDHDALKPRSDGAGARVPHGPRGGGAGGKATPVPGPAMAGSPVCPTSDPCADEYGAAQVRVEVVP